MIFVFHSLASNILIFFGDFFFRSRASSPLPPTKKRSVGSCTEGSLGTFTLLRLLRLLRLTRMVRLMRKIPELLTLIKGIVAAARSQPPSDGIHTNNTIVETFT